MTRHMSQLAESNQDLSIPLVSLDMSGNMSNFNFMNNSQNLFMPAEYQFVDNEEALKAEAEEAPKPHIKNLF
jgi:hypothetical protein